MNRGGALLIIAALLLFYGLFGMDRSGTTTATRYYLGLVLLPISFGLLVRSGWRGNPGSWIVAAAGVFIATWTLYELLRQGPCLTGGSGIVPIVCNAIPFGMGQIAAPLLSTIAALALLVVGRLRLQRLSNGATKALDIHRP